MMQSFWKCVIIAALLVCATTVQSSFFGPRKVTTSCCKSVSKAYIPFKATGFKWQNTFGPCVEAVVFFTVKGRICSDPTAPWVKKKMEVVSQNVLREGGKMSSNLTAAIATTS